MNTVSVNHVTVVLSLGSISLLVRLTEIREIFYLQDDNFFVYIKDITQGQTNGRDAQGKV